MNAVASVTKQCRAGRGCRIASRHMLAVLLLGTMTMVVPRGRCGAAASQNCTCVDAGPPGD